MSANGSDHKPKLTSRDEFQFIIDLVLKHSAGDQTFIALQDWNGGTTRFANNEIVQNVTTRRVSLSVTVAFGQRHGSAGTTDLSAGSVQETLRLAEHTAKVSPPDPEYLPPVALQHYQTLPTWCEETAAAGPDRRLEDVRAAVELCQGKNLTSAGIVCTSGATVGVSANSGLFAYEPRTEARFSLTAMGGNSTGWAATTHRSLDQLRVRDRTQTAIEKAKESANPKEIPAGRYTVILEPSAVAGLLSRIIWMLDAKSYDKGTSPFTGRLGRPIVDHRLTLRNAPEHSDLLGKGFTSEGLPSNSSTWIEKGVLKHLAYDRFTAKAHGIETIPTIEAPCLSVDGEVWTSTEDLIRTTDRGILVTNFWYIRSVNPTDLTLTGMTRDGTFLIEQGRVTTPIRNFRFHESPLRALNHLEEFTIPMEAASEESGKMLVPAMKLRDFNFSSVTRF